MHAFLIQRVAAKYLIAENRQSSEPRNVPFVTPFKTTQAMSDGERLCRSEQLKWTIYNASYSDKKGGRHKCYRVLSQPPEIMTYYGVIPVSGLSIVTITVTNHPPFLPSPW